MRWILASSTGLFAIALGAGVLSAFNPAPVATAAAAPAQACPPAIARGRGHFFKVNTEPRMLLDLGGTYGDIDEETILTSVTLLGRSGHHDVGDLASSASYASYYLQTIDLTGVPASKFWNRQGVGSISPTTAWTGDPESDYTVVALYSYLIRPSAGIPYNCRRTDVIHFDDITLSPWVRSNDVVLTGSDGSGSTGATASCNGMFFGGAHYALYDGYVDSDSAARLASVIECYSSSDQDHLYMIDATTPRTPFKIMSFPAPEDTWHFPSIRDLTYDGSATWYVGFRVIYSDPANPSFSNVAKSFTGLNGQQGTGVPGG